MAPPTGRHHLLIADKRRRRAAFVKRSRGLIKKAEELSALCDADVCLLISEDEKLRHWPEDRSQVHRVISRLCNIENKKKKKKNEAEAEAEAEFSQMMRGLEKGQQQRQAAISLDEFEFSDFNADGVDELPTISYSQLLEMESDRADDDFSWLELPPLMEELDDYR